MPAQIFKPASPKCSDILRSAKDSMLHSDGAKVYVALQNDIRRESQDKWFSPPYTSELNKIAERVNCTMVEAVLSMLTQASLASQVWPFALNHAIHVRNRVPHSTPGSTLYLLRTTTTPSLTHIRVFECTEYVLQQPVGSKFGSHAYKGVYLETMEHVVYKILITDDDGVPRMSSQDMSLSVSHALLVLQLWRSTQMMNKNQTWRTLNQKMVRMVTLTYRIIK